MDWYVYIAYLGAGVFLSNSIPHFVQGVSGNRFQSPFAKPPGVGESSPLVNVLWGFFNFVVGYALLLGVGDFEAGLNLSSLVTGIGALLNGLFLARHFGQVRNK
jgi:hypothetical protein